jgi:hypothetical protein
MRLCHRSREAVLWIERPFTESDGIFKQSIQLLVMHLARSIYSGRRALSGTFGAVRELPWTPKGAVQGVVQGLMWAPATLNQPDLIPSKLQSVLSSPL